MGSQAGELLVGHADVILDRLTAAESGFEAKVCFESLGPDAPRRKISIATLGCGYEAPAVDPMREVLRRVAQEHCFACDARVS